MTQTSSKKMTRRERENQAVTRRYMLIGGGMFAAASAAGIAAALAPPDFPKLKGGASIDQRLDQAGITEHILRLSGPREKTDILVIGNTECHFCQKFVAEGLGDLVSFAKTEKLGLAYAPIGSGASSLGSTRLLSCFAKAGAAGPSKILKQVYAAGEALRSGTDFGSAARRYGSEIGVSEADIQACITEDPLEATKRIQATTVAFAVSGTPAFYVASPNTAGIVRWFSGFSGASGLVRQAGKARELG